MPRPRRPGAPAWGFRRWGAFPPYVSVAERREVAARYVAARRPRDRALAPVAPSGRGRALARTFWGRAWCDNLAAYAALVNRLQRGRSYLRNGLVIHLGIEAGAVTALVSGSEVYQVDVRIEAMARPRWRALVTACAGKIDSVVELLAGRFDQGVMDQVCRQGTGLFPAPAEIRYRCTCPDGARGSWLCKHVAATLYGVGVRLDDDPEMLFRLREVAHTELLAGAAAGLTRPASPSRRGRRVIAEDRLAAVFGIELEAAPAPRARPATTARRLARAPAGTRKDRRGR